ncbi:MAG TPA: M56 family metallopeptidase [Nocardioidaceae bacterium]|nr:M56 family metallopeptidase [Nocardioidaceae bacterium]
MLLLLLAAVPLTASAALGLAAPWVGNRLPPSTAVKVLATAALTSALTTGFCLSVIAFNALARIPVIAALGKWSAAAVGLDDTPPPMGGVVLGLAVIGLMLAALRRSVLTATDLTQAVLTCRRLQDLSEGLVLVPDPSPGAFALPGMRGKIVITTGMLQALTAPERRALIAHEQAHLSHHHQIYIQATELAAAANPLLFRLPGQVRAQAERWADEQAAQDVDDRMLTARALAKAALARTTNPRSTTPQPAIALPATDHHMANRVLALTKPPPRPRPRLASALLALVLTSVASSILVAHTTETKFEHAQQSYSHLYRPHDG